MQKKANTNEISCPALHSAIENDYLMALEEGEKMLGENWKNKEVVPCKKCSSTGMDLQDGGACIGCDGTGVDYSLEYGVEDGVFFSKVVQNGIDALLEYCKLRREEELATGNVWVTGSMKNAYALPSAGVANLMAKSYPIQEWIDEGDHRSIANVVSKECPHYLTTNMRKF